MFGIEDLVICLKSPREAMIGFFDTSVIQGPASGPCSCGGQVNARVCILLQAFPISKSSQSITIFQYSYAICNESKCIHLVNDNMAVLYLEST